jgi:hypothetical protein
VADTSVIGMPLKCTRCRVKEINNAPAVIYLHPEGKIAEAAPGGKMEQLEK